MSGIPNVPTVPPAPADGPEPRRIRYDRDPQSLFFPGRATDFFPRGDAVSEAALCAEMARVAYVKHETGGPERERLARTLRAVGFDVHDLLDAGGTQGFVADGRTRESGPVRVIAFRGTEPDDFRDLLLDLDARPRRWGPEAIVHRGFARAFAHVEERVEAAAARAPGTVLFTGHSLGAAIATLAASRHPAARLYTLGSPRVGDAAFAALVPAARHERYVDYVDAVTRVPPHGFGFGYVHTGPGHFIDARGDIQPGLADEEIRARQAAGESGALGLAEVVDVFRARKIPEKLGIPLRDLTDHAPINYVAA
ncbi:MAG TPA: lipase family protein, partial [Methylomirabilota bacterium]|nr:lipase family protein [Methylomirabilota bacterium]